MILALTGVPLVIVSIIAFILILGIIILVHEGGHYLFAKKAGILVHEFSIGMGPAIFKKKHKETTFCIRAIPIGGYASLAGEESTEDLVTIGAEVGLNLVDNRVTEIILDPNTMAMVRGKVISRDLYGKDNKPLYITLDVGISQYYEVERNAFYVLEKGNRLQLSPYDRCFESKSLWQRFLTIFAGPMMNFILAIIIYLIISFVSGVPNYNSSEIGSVSNYNPYITQVDLRAGDKIKSVTIDGVRTEVGNWNEFSAKMEELLAKSTTNLDLIVIRNNEEVKISCQCYTYIASLGLSNIDFPLDIAKPEGITSNIVVGNINLRYLDDGQRGTYPLQKGDIITKVKIDKVLAGGNIERGEVVPVDSWDQLIALFKDADVVNVKFEYYSQSKKGTVKIDECASLQTYGNEVLNNQRIEKIQIKLGVSPTYHFDFFASIGVAFSNFWSDFTLIFRTLGLLIAPQSGIRQVGVGDLSSFVGIYSLIQSFLVSGILSLMGLMAMLSVNVGVINLLPIPAFDGGRIVFLGYELITKKRPSKKFESILNFIFLILILILFVVVTYNDILRLIRG